FGPADKKDPLSLYNKLLFEQGRMHENQVIETRYPQVERIEFKTPEEGFMLLLEGMTKGSNVLCGTPAFYLPEGLAGVFDVVERRSGKKSIFGDYHYVVKEIKLARNIRDRHVFQAAFYNYLLGKIQGYTPPTFYLINRDAEELAHDFDEAKLLGILKDIREIFNGKQVNPTFKACQWPWETYNNNEAKRIRDVSLVSGVGPSFKKKLVEKGVRTVDDLAKTHLDELIEIPGIGEKTARKFSRNSQAIVLGKHIRIDAPHFPKRSTEIFLDLEGTGEQIQDEELVAIDYLIGVLIRKNAKQIYIPFVAHQLNQEKEMFCKFIEWLLGQTDFVVYHWHHYERVHLQRLVERYGLSKEARPLFANMQDLYKDAISSFAFPTCGNGLKEIAAYIGHTWKHKEVNAMESIALYFQYIQDPTKNKDKLEKVIDYNKDDCVATLLIKDWLERESASG
ncbi:TM0106 family RecB-like putative nuclease, partial [Candidatus Bathyarchaeota archaeon]|nr:TM0106 family RecB-like putative nuclease [Candidatus Bathyarchaeota archaeon]